MEDDDKVTVTVTVSISDLQFVLSGAEYGAEASGRAYVGLRATIRRVRKAFQKAGIPTEY